MDQEFQEHEARRLARDARQNAEDFANEQAGRDVGRIERHGYGDVRAVERKRREDDEKRRDILLSARYLAKYDAVMASLTDAEALIYDALIEASEALSEMRDKAAYLPDGTKVFMDADSNIYDENGQLVSAARAKDIDWPKDAPSWEEYKRAKDRHADLTGKQDRLAGIRDRMEDKDNPPSEDDLDAFQKDVDAIRQSVRLTAESPELEHSDQQPDNQPSTDLNLDQFSI